MTELLDIFEAEGVDSAFWFTFAGDGLGHDADPAATSTWPATAW